MVATAQSSFNEATEVFFIHSSGNHIEMGTDGGGWHHERQMVYMTSKGASSSTQHKGNTL